MVEQQTGKVIINDTGVSSKEGSGTNDWGSVKTEITDYWDISGGGGDMELSPASESNNRGNMKLEDTANFTMANANGNATTPNRSGNNDNVTSSTAEENSTAMKNETAYCENGQCAMKSNLVGLDENDNPKLNHNSNNNVSNNAVTPDGDVISKGGPGCKNSDVIVENTEKDKDNRNVISHQTEHNTVGTEVENGKKLKNDVNDTVSGNTETSGAKDNCADGGNKTALSIREQMMLDGQCTEERFRIDRKKLEQMLQAATEGRGQSGEAFFQKIMDETSTFITWPSKLKIGAKSKKDPHIRICGKPDDIKEARQRIMVCLDTKSNRVTIKMDVSHTEHSHVIGKGGNNIKRVMQETGCHIHFPDSNRNTAGEKSNQVSITGHPEGVENARLKIRTLLPIVLQFEIPSTGLPPPDPNSPMIQHLVQAYGISIQFKQRIKVYSISCTVRGSADNTDGLKKGIQALMNHVAGAQLPVTTQIEIAPLHHNYMLTKTGLNVTSITQATGARIIFPDPAALPKKSTVYISGSVDSVILARHKLMGCLPLLLMFDIKEESSSTNNDTSRVARLMETLELSITIKSKPKQTSRTVIIKSIECNIYNMFEARAKLLGLDSSGVSRPAQSLSPKMSRNTTMTPTPVILLAHSHVATPTVQTAVIGLPEQKAVTPLTNVVLGGPSYVLTHTVPSNTPTPRPLSAALSSVHTPSQSPFPTIANGGITSSISGAQMTSNMDPTKDELHGNTYDITNHISSPCQMPITQTAKPMMSTQGQYQNVNVTNVEDVQRQINQKLGIMGKVTLPNTMAGSNEYVFKNSTTSGQSVQNANFRRPSQSEELNAAATVHSLYARTTPDNRVLLSPNYDPRSVRPMSGMSQDETCTQDREQLKMNLHLLQQPGGRFRNPQGIITNEEYLRQQLGISEQGTVHPNSVESDNQVLAQMSSAISPSSRRQSYSQAVRSPDSIAESRASLASDRISPVSTISRNSNPRMSTYDQYDEHIMNQASPPGSSAAAFQSLASKDMSNLSPINQHRSPPQIVLNQNSQGGFDGNEIRDSSRLGELYPQQSQDDISTGPPPGFEGFTPQGHKMTNYEDLCKRAKKAMENKPVPSEVRTPTDIWAGYGFSKSMPYEMKEELKKLASSKGRFRTNLPTTYENGENERNQPSPVEEESEYSLNGRSPNQLHVPSDTGKGGSSLSAWRRRRMANMNLSLGGNMGLQYISTVQRPTPQKHSAFTRVNPNESLNRSSNSPKSNLASNANETIPQPQRQVISSPFNNSGNESTLHAPLPDKLKGFDSRISMNSTPTIQDSLGLGTANSGSTNSKVEPDISDVLTRLGLSKYISVFQQQEVDYQTFLTLTESDLKELGIATFGPRKKMLIAIKDLNSDRDVFSGTILKDATVHENISDQMLQLQRLQLQQHRDNPQTAPTNLDSHPLLSQSRPLFNGLNSRLPNHLDKSAMDRFNEESNQRNMNSNHVRPTNASRLWHSSRTSGSSSGRW